MIAIFKSVQATNCFLDKMEEDCGPRCRLSLVLRRQLVSAYLSESAQATRREAPVAIKRGHVAGLLALTAGLGPTVTGDMGSLLVTGPVRREMARRANNLRAALGAAGIALALVEEIMADIGRNRVLLMFDTGSDTAQWVAWLRACGAEKIFHKGAVLTEETRTDETKKIATVEKG